MSLLSLTGGTGEAEMLTPVLSGTESQDVSEEEASIVFFPLSLTEMYKLQPFT